MQTYKKQSVSLHFSKTCALLNSLNICHIFSKISNFKFSSNLLALYLLPTLLLVVEERKQSKTFHSHWFALKFAVKICCSLQHKSDIYLLQLYLYSLCIWIQCRWRISMICYPREKSKSRTTFISFLANSCELWAEIHQGKAIVLISQHGIPVLF